MNRYWVDKTDGIDDVSAQDFNSAFAAIETEMDDKVDKEIGKGLSSNDFTNEEKSKLAAIPQDAEANVQSDWNQTDTAADDYIKNKPILEANSIEYWGVSGRYSGLVSPNVSSALNYCLDATVRTSAPTEGQSFRPLVIYNLGLQTSLTIVLDSGYLYGDWMQVDFVSGTTPTNFTINSNGAYMTPLDITISANKVYSLFFDMGVVDEEGNIGWRISYAEYDYGTV